MKKILCITRVSTDRQDLTQQHNEMEQWLTTTLHYKSEEIEWLEAKGASAQSINEKYIEFVDTMFKKFDEIPTLTACCAWHLNRFGRNEDYLGKIKTFFVSRGIQCYIKTLNLTLLSPQPQTDGSIKYVVDFGAGIAWSVFASIVYYEALELKQKSMRAKKQMKSEGKYIGHTVTYGYQYNRKTNEFEVNEEEAQWVRLAFNLYVYKGYSQRKVYSELLKAGFKGRNNTPSIALVQNGLKDPQYYGGERNGIKLPQIVSRELWDRAQEESSVRRMNNTDSNRNVLLRKLIKCPDCGHYYGAQGPLYECGGTKDKNTDCHNNNGLSIKALDAKAFEITSRIYPWLAVKNEQEQNQPLEDRMNELNTYISGCNNNIQDYNSRLDTIQNEFIDGNLTSVQYKKSTQKLSDKIKDEESKKSKYEDELLNLKENTTRVVDTPIDFTTLLFDKINELNQGDFDKLYKAVGMVIDHIIPFKDPNNRYKKRIDFYLYNGVCESYNFYPKRRGNQWEFISEE